MKKSLLISVIAGLVTLAHATTYDVFSNVNCNNNNYGCSLPIGNIGSNQQITDCTFTFTTVDCSGPGILFCDLAGDNTTCNVSSQKGSDTTWTCTLDTDQINYLNGCVSSGKCNLDLYCFGNWNIGGCSCTYDCSPCPTQTVPDGTSTFALLGGALLSLELVRRKLTPALAK